MTLPAGMVPAEHCILRKEYLLQMFHMLQPLRFMVPLFLLISLVTACGGGGAASDPGKGKAAILLTDRFENKITDREGNLITTAREIWVTFNEMALKPVKGEWVGIFSGPPDKSVDLLALRGKADLIALIDLPPGAYNKARMKIEKAWFIDSEGVRHDVIVPSGRVTIKFKHPLMIQANDQTDVLFDFIPGKSIHLVETGNGKFVLRPVVRVRVSGEEVTEFIKIEGRIVSVDCAADRLMLDPRHGKVIAVELEDALIVLKDGSFFGGKEDDNEDEHKKEAARIASCQQLQKDQAVEVVGTGGDEEGMIPASLVQIEKEESAANRLEFTGTLLAVDCDQRTIRVTFSGGEIVATLHPEAELSANDQAVPSSAFCNQLKGALQKRIEVEGRVENNQMIAVEITLLPAASPLLPIRAEGTVASVRATGAELLEFVIQTDSGQSYNVTVDGQTRFKGPNGDPTPSSGLLNQRVRVEGTLKAGTTPHPTIQAAEVTLLSPS
jgi:hypothetical protein